MKDRYDSIVVGAGAGGLVAAGVLAESGREVLVLERGDFLGLEGAGTRDHLRNQRLSALGHNTGPDIEGNPRVLEDEAGRRILAPHQSGYQNNAATVGGGTLVYGGQAWRFLPQDFRMASIYGMPAGSSLTDWPFPYEELAPWYQIAEQQIGVAGDSPGAATRWPRAADYPMPPVPRRAVGRVLEAGARKLGIGTLSPPLLVNSVPYQGRPACIACGSCVGFSCPVNGKNGTWNTMLPRAMATGRCTLVTRAMVAQVTSDGDGHVTGVSVLVEGPEGITRHEVTAREVVLAGGAVETARLLLASGTSKEPEGLGNNSDQVGRNLQGHSSSRLFGLFEEDLNKSRGPGVTIATTDWNHGNPDVIGGGLVADDFTVLPVIHFKQMLPPGQRRWGLDAKEHMRRNWARLVLLWAPVHEIPNPDARVRLDDSVRDRFGLRVARLSGRTHPETLRTAGYLHDRALEWLRASGAARVWGQKPLGGLSGGQHQAGTARMGTEPDRSVTDPDGKVWGHDNLWVADGSLHPTNGGFNPVLTIMALAFRTAHKIAAG